MAKVDAPITYTKWATEDGLPTQYFYQLILDLWRRTGGFSDAVQDSDSGESYLSSRVSGLSSDIGDLMIDTDPSIIGRVANLASRILVLEHDVPANTHIHEASNDNIIQFNPVNIHQRLDDLESVDELVGRLQFALAHVNTKYQVETSVNYTISGSFDHETVICTNTSAITITLPVLKDIGWTVIRGNTGTVAIDGNGTNITGSATISLAAQYDSANGLGASSEWLLK